MKRTPLRKVSEKQAEKNRIWKEITEQRCKELEYLCQYCGGKGQRDDPARWDWLTGHHIVSRARGGDYTKENCYLCHKTPCHSTITDHNVQVQIGDYKTRELFY